MDAKVLRAAVSAAIRVTVSTTLMGCGGNVTSNGAASDGGMASGGASTAKRGVSDPPQIATTTPTTTTTSGGVAGAPPSTSVAGGATLGGRGGNEPGGSGGMQLSAAGAAEGGDGPSKPTDMCQAVGDCISSLESSGPGAPLSSAEKVCCETVLDGMNELVGAGFAECWANLNGRFYSTGAHQVCCAGLNAWQNQACTPWGPPVPPSLSESALLSWGAAA